MVTNKKIARQEAKRIIINYKGVEFAKKVNEMRAKFGVTTTQNAFNYFQFSPAQQAFRIKYNYSL